jgi:P27 family predicted phage terminase small subunit
MGLRGPRSTADLAIVPLRSEARRRRPETFPAPSHLNSETAAWWRAVVSDFELEPHHRRLLQAACEAWDRCQQARAAISDHGLTFTDERGMVRSRPEVQIERDSRTAFMRAVRELDLESDGPREVFRPPALRSNRGRRACR